MGHNGGFNPYRDRNGEFATPEGSGKPGPSRRAGTVGGGAKGYGPGGAAINGVVRTAGPRQTKAQRAAAQASVEQGKRQNEALTAQLKTATSRALPPVTLHASTKLPKGWTRPSSPTDHSTEGGSGPPNSRMRYISDLKPNPYRGSARTWRELTTDSTGKVVRDRYVLQDAQGQFFLGHKIDPKTGVATYGRFDPEEPWNGQRYG